MVMASAGDIPTLETLAAIDLMRRHPNLHVRGYKEAGSVTTPFDMALRNDLDRFHLVMERPEPKTRGVANALCASRGQSNVVHQRCHDRSEGVRDLAVRKGSEAPPCSKNLVIAGAKTCHCFEVRAEADNRFTADRLANFRVECRGCAAPVGVEHSYKRYPQFAKHARRRRQVRFPAHLHDGDALGVGVVAHCAKDKGQREPLGLPFNEHHGPCEEHFTALVVEVGRKSQLLPFGEQARRCPTHRAPSVGQVEADDLRMSSGVNERRRASRIDDLVAQVRELSKQSIQVTLGLGGKKELRLLDEDYLPGNPLDAALPHRRDELLGRGGIARHQLGTGGNPTGDNPGRGTRRNDAVASAQERGRRRIKGDFRPLARAPLPRNALAVQLKYGRHHGLGIAAGERRDRRIGGK